MGRMLRSAPPSKARLVSVLVTGLLSLGVLAAPATAQPPQQGLVNVAVTDNTVQVPIGVAANICGVTAAVLSDQINTGSVDCTAISNATAFSQGSGGSGGPQQNGLVNIAVSGNTVQIPVSAAANVCGVGVSVLSQFVNTADVACTARSRSSAQG